MKDYDYPYIAYIKKYKFKILKILFTIILFVISANTFAQTNTVADTISKVTIEVRTKILSDSKDGGELDFWTPIKGHEYDGALIQTGPTAKDNIYASKREIAILKWAYILSKFGIKKSDIISLYQELKGRKVRDDEVTLIDLGIKKSTH